jgi:hypothetical protein
MKSTTPFCHIETEAGSYTDLGSRTLPALSPTPLAELKAALVKRLSLEFPEVQSRLVRQAVVEAEALASCTSVPHLLLPTLAEEKVLSLSNWTAHQRAIAGNSRLAFVA